MECMFVDRYVLNVIKTSVIILNELVITVICTIHHYLFTNVKLNLQNIHGVITY